MAPFDPTEARCAKVEGIVWDWLSTYRAGPYAWSKRATLSRYLDDGSLAIDNNATERASCRRIRGVAGARGRAARPATEPGRLAAGPVHVGSWLVSLAAFLVFGTLAVQRFRG